MLLVGVSWFFLAKRFQGIIPGPGEVWEALSEDIGPRAVARAITVTLVNSLSGYLIAMVLAMLLVAGAYVNSHVDAFVRALNTFIQSVSVLVWAIIFVMMFGITSRKPPILVAAAASFPILLSGVYSSVRALDSRFRLLARLLGASKWQELAYFIVPGTIPYLAASSRSAIGVALRISVVAEAFGASGGVGYWLMYSYDYAWSAGVFAWAIVLIGLMIGVDLLLLARVERLAERWKI